MGPIHVASIVSSFAAFSATLERRKSSDRFRAYLDWAVEEVKSWPKWKQGLLGRTEAE
jgi:hypothetical protein